MGLRDAQQINIRLPCKYSPSMKMQTKLKVSGMRPIIKACRCLDGQHRTTSERPSSFIAYPSRREFVWKYYCIIRPLRNSEQKGSQFRNQRNGTQICHVHHIATSVGPTSQRQYGETRRDDHARSTFDRLHAYL